MSHRTPSPSVRPVTRERSPKRVLLRACVAQWVVHRCLLVAAPGASSARAASYHPLTRRAGKPTLVGPPGSCEMHRVAARYLAALSVPRQTKEERLRARINPDLMIAVHAILS